MKKLLILLLFAASAFALTPTERKIVQHAQTELHAGIAKYNEADARAAAAAQHAGEADAHANDTDGKLKVLSGEIETAHKNEQTLAGQVKKYKGFWDAGHKYWGIGAIGLGIGLLFKHLLIAAAVLLALGVGLYIASFFFPVISVGLTVVRKFIAVALVRFSVLIHKHPLTVAQS